ncbi:hypothetical protein ACHAXA_005332 [Cyclostephanos tholiformis]|uniref:CCT domain-containing protein n=1 Tax=Cyclostephanos tholiformis TaxID=382380 RepID=A0ABD3RAP8_9STRA
MATTRSASTRSATTRSATTSAPPQQQQQQSRRGNLGSVLMSYDHSSRSEDQRPEQSMGHRLTIDVTEMHVNAIDDGLDNDDDGHDDDRVRSLTLGSEFDLSWIVGGTKDGRGMSISSVGGLLAPLGEYNNNATTSAAVAMDDPTVVSSDVSASASDAGRVQTTMTQQQQQQQRQAAGTSTSAGGVAQRWQQQQQQHMPAPARSRGDSTASASLFLNGLFHHHHHQQQQQQQPPPPRPHGQHTMMAAHTPPTQMGNSYENSHFGKRMRAGSISGRLRSMSDLEDAGTISREQKSILKDLIIAGDDSVQCAIDRYEAGDASALEEMVRGGYLLARSSADVDLLEDLDLDFLNVHEGYDDEEGGDGGGMMFGNMDYIDDGAQQPVIRSHSRRGDGIGDLEFNGDFTSSFAASPSSQSAQPYPIQQMATRGARGNSVDDIEIHRYRANSLAVPGSLLDGVNTDDDSQISFGRWMDKHVAGPPRGKATAAQRRRQFATDDAVDASLQLLMASKFEGPVRTVTTTIEVEASEVKKTKAKKEKTKKSPSSSPIKKEKKEPRERKSQSKMKDMMEGITSSNVASILEGELDEVSEEVPSGLGRPRSMSDPNLSVRLDDHGLLHVVGPEGWVGAYSPDSRQLRVNRFLEKRNHRVWVKKVKYDVRKNFADSRLRVKGRFVKKEDEMLMRELMSLT